MIKKKFLLVKVSTDKNLADDLTKPLDTKTKKRPDQESALMKQQILSPGPFRGHVSSVGTISV